MRLLLVEDDEMIGETIAETLRQAGYAVDWARDAKEADLSLLHDLYDLVMLDLGLPGDDGLNVLKRYRLRQGNAPAIILTARDEVQSRIGGLDAGADDYLVKPFDLEELSARVRALLRRRIGQANPLCVHGGLVLNPITHEVSLDGRPLALVPREFSLLHILIEEPSRVFTRSELEEKLYGWDEEVGSNTIQVHIHSLRRKIGADRIVNVRGVGYRLQRLA